MFGVQFAVSSGRCTRGAFMLLIRVNEDVKKVLNCDFMVIIDTEGLKSPELAQLDNSHEHDNELATLVVGLSDITIVNIAMENSTEMKDILQIVVHAFLRMKEVGKKPKCQFVHQNVSDVSAHEKNLRDRKLLLQQLNEMTQAAAKMEKKEENKSFTDVMEYSPDTGNWYIPGLWNGNPPMAPVNAGYSEAVYELKKNIIQMLGNCNSSANKISEFTEWMSSLWTAVKHENFIFSFRNSLVADAYMRLCTKFNKWEWEFKKGMYTWVTDAETKISNFGKFASKSGKHDMRELLTSLKNEACTVLSKWETELLENLTQYFKQTEGHVYLVEGYKEEFSNSAKSLRGEMERCLTQNKEKFRADFKDVFNKRDQCQKKAEEFTDRCLKPAVKDFVNRSLGPDIIDEMQTCKQFSTRMFFQYAVLLDLLSKDDFEKCLHKNKEKFPEEDVFNEQDQCQKKAEEFTDRCLKPAVEDFVNRSLGPDIVGEMLTCHQFSTRYFFQYAVLLDLLTKDNFEKYLSYICSYEDYVKEWTFDRIMKHFSDLLMVSKFEDQRLQSSIKSINNVMENAKKGKSGNLKTFVEDICKELGDKLVISQDALGAFMILNNANQEEFAHWLTQCMKEMAQALRETFKKNEH
eukprot:superscaffoldBa00006313_g21384